MPSALKKKRLQSSQGRVCHQEMNITDLRTAHGESLNGRPKPLEHYRVIHQDFGICA